MEQLVSFVVVMGIKFDEMTMSTGDCAHFILFRINTTAQCSRNLVRYAIA